MSESSEPGPVCWQTHKELGFKYNKIFSDYIELKKQANECLDFASWIISKHILNLGIANKDELSEYIQRQFEIFKRESENENSNI